MKRINLKQALARVDALPRRDRLALLGGGLAVLAGIEFQLVLGLHDKRVAFVRNEQEPAQAQAQAQAEERARLQARVSDLGQQLAQRRQQLGLRGVSLPPQAVFNALRQTLKLQGVTVLSLRALPDDDSATVRLQAAAPPDGAGAAGADGDAGAAGTDTGNAADASQANEPAAPAGDAASAATAATEAQAPVLYRHRAELRVAGRLPDVLRTLREFETPGATLRLDRVRLAASESDPQTVEATLLLFTLSQERTWLAM